MHRVGWASGLTNPNPFVSALVIVVPVVEKEFKGPDPWVMISNFHAKIDGCVGQSTFIRWYATLTRMTDESDEVPSYVGVTKAV